MLGRFQVIAPAGRINDEGKSSKEVILATFD